MVNNITLKSSRLFLRTYLEKDFQGILNLQEENKNLVFFKLDNEIKKIDQLIDEVNIKNHIFSIILQNFDSFIGLCGLEIIEADLKANIFYALLSNFWNNGFGFEAVNKLIKFAFTKLQLNEIRAHVIDGNTSGWKVVERVGLKYMGQNKVQSYKVMLFSINKKEYLNQNWY